MEAQNVKMWCSYLLSCRFCNDSALPTISDTIIIIITQHNNTWCVYNCSQLNGACSSKLVHDVVDSRWISDVTSSSSSLSVWNRSEVPASSWHAAAAAAGLAHRILGPPPGCDGDRSVYVDEDSDVVDRVTLPRVGRRSAAAPPVISPSTFEVRQCLFVISCDRDSMQYCVELHNWFREGSSSPTARIPVLDEGRMKPLPPVDSI